MDIPKTSRDHPTLFFGSHFLNQSARESQPPVAPKLQGQGVHSWSGKATHGGSGQAPCASRHGEQAAPAPVPPKAFVSLCVLVTLEASTLDSVATGFVSSHTEF